MNNKDLLNYIKNGATLDNNLQKITKNYGYMVSIIGMEKTFLPEQLEEIKNTIKEYQEKLKVNQFIGVWNYEGLVYIDISRHYKNKQDAIKNGIINKQLAIYDLKNKCDIKLMKKVYILYKYNKIKNDITYIAEFKNVKTMEKELQTSYNTLKSYIIKNIDEPLKELLKDRYVIVMDNALISDLI
jgi:hypothetical protein